MIAQHLTGLLFSTMALAISTSAGPPLLTDDPDTPGPNHWEINVATTSEKHGDEWELETPLLDINYGIGDRIQLKYEVPWVVIDGKSEAARGGLGNSMVGVKWHFLDQEKAWLDVSTYPQFEFNHGTDSVDRGLAEEGWSVLLPAELSHNFGRLTVFSEVGYVWNEQRPNEWFYGIATEYEISDKFSIMGELHGDAEQHFRDDELVFNLGFHWQFNQRISLLMSAGRAIRESSEGSPDFLSYLALQFTL